MILKSLLRCVVLALTLMGAAFLGFARSDTQSGTRSAGTTGSIAPPAAEAVPCRTVILVRHAEKDTSGDARDPHLCEAGHKRAQALARLLGKARVTHLFASEFQRTQETLAPLADATHVKVEVLGAAKSSELVAALQKLPPQSVALVAGHSNTIPALARELGVVLTDLDPKGHLDEKCFDRLFILTLPPGGAQVPASVLELRYGD